jgi:hypothetical protein
MNKTVLEFPYTHSAVEATRNGAAAIWGKCFKRFIAKADQLLAEPPEITLWEMLP